jgi:putative ABC transport system permease protein
VVRFSQLVLRNSVRSPVRTLMTVVTVAILLAAFVFPRTLVDAQERQVRDSPNNRVITQPRVGWGGQLPARYGDEIRATPGIKQAVGARWTGFRVPGKDNLFFAAFAMDPEPFIAMHHELVAPREQKEAWLHDDKAVIVSVDLAKELGWKLGDRVIFQSREVPGEWAYTVQCIYEAVGGEWAKRSLWVHYASFNRMLPLEERDKITFVSAEIFEPNQGGRIAKALDLHFDAAPVRTLTLEDRVQTAANIGRFRALLTAMDVVSYLILLVVLSILANTLAMNVRERAREFAVLRALGFGSVQLTTLVAGEAVVLGLAGTLLGLGLSYPLIEGVLGPLLQEAFQFPPVEIPARVALTAVLAGTSLAIASCILPALRLVRHEVAASFGHVA